MLVFPGVLDLLPSLFALYSEYFLSLLGPLLAVCRHFGGLALSKWAIYPVRLALFPCNPP